MKIYIVFLALASIACSGSHGRVDAGPAIDGSVLPDADLTCRLPSPERRRPSASACAMDGRPFPAIVDPPSFLSCFTHAECTDGINGRCIGSGRNGYHCSYDECFSDTECSEGPCECREVGGSGFSANRCMQGNCQVDADCGVGGACSPTLGVCGDFGGAVGYFCHTCEDTCTDDSDCGGGSPGLPSYCAYDELVGRWACQDSYCAG